MAAVEKSEGNTWQTMRACRMIFSMSRPNCATILLALGFWSQVHAAPTPQYIRQAAGSRGVIVFVHGLFGDGKTSWTNDRSHAYWPDLLTKDTTFNGFDV
jgi:hypothetical protein